MTKNRKMLEKEVTDEIRGVKYGGMQGASAFTFFRENYYEKIQEQEEKAAVLSILIDRLKNERHDYYFRSQVAWICADIGIPGIEVELSKLLKEPEVNTEPYINPSSYRKIIEYSLHRFELEKKLKVIIAAYENTDKKHIEEMFARFCNELSEQLKDPSEKTDVINLLAKFIKSNLFDRAFRIKAAWITVHLGIFSIKEEIVKLSEESSWKDTPYRSSLDEIVTFIDDQKKRGK